MNYGGSAGGIDFEKIWSNIEIRGCDKDSVLLQERMVYLLVEWGLVFTGR